MLEPTSQTPQNLNTVSDTDLAVINLSAYDTSSIVEWISSASGSTLYKGFAARTEGESPFQTIVSTMFPAHDDYQDKALLNSLTQQLDSPSVLLLIIESLNAIPASETDSAVLPVDLATPLSTATRQLYFHKIAEYAMNPESLPWLSQAISSAQTMPSMRALSLATRLRQERSTITSAFALRTASLLVPPVEPVESTSLQDAPDLQALLSDYSVLNRWNPGRGADELFLNVGIDLLSTSDGSGRKLRLSAHETWEALAHTAAFKTLFAPLLADMGWYGAQVNEHASPKVTQALAGHAIVAFFLLATESDGNPIERFFYSEQAGQYSHVGLIEQLRKEVIKRQPTASPAAVSVLMYLLLREMAPELLVQNLPDSLNYGRSLQSVSFLQGVCLLEALAPGTAQSSRFDEVVLVSVQTVNSDNPRIRELWAKARVVPALRYAIAHNAVVWTDGSDIRQASPAQVTQALTFLKEQQDLHAKALHNLLTLKVPDREQIARHQLGEAGVNPSIWGAGPRGEEVFTYLEGRGFYRAPGYEWSRLTATGDELGLGKQATVLELVMMGELNAVDKPRVPEVYKQAFAAFHQAMTQAETVIIRRLLDEMPSAQRTLLATSTCEISRLQFQGGEGEQGVFIRCQPGDHRHDYHRHAANEETFFEIIPAAGVARQVSQGFDYHVPEPDYTWDIVTNGQKEQLWHQAQALAKVTPLNPVDSDAYLLGSVSRSTVRPAHPLKATLIPAPALVFLPAASEALALDAVAAAVAEHLLTATMASLKQLHTHETGWEQIWSVEKKIADFTARFIIPFYGCIKDLAAGDKSAGTAIGCTMDIIFALIPLGEFAGSTARLVMRAGELSVFSITEQMSKEMAQLALSLVEQSGIFLIRDVPKLLWKMSSLAWKTLLEQVPALARVFFDRESATGAAMLKSGMYLLPESLEDVWNPNIESADQRAIVDGYNAVAVRNLGTAESPVFRLLDPYAKKAFGEALTVISKGETLELTRLSASGGLSVGHYPKVIPVTVAEQGGIEMRVAGGCEASTIERESGVFDITVDGHAYRLDSNQTDPALRALEVEKLSARSGQLEELPTLCRTVRDLIPGAPCADYVKLVLPAIEVPLEVAGVPATLGQHSSAAFSAREYQLARITLPHGTVDVLTHEGKFCKWDHQVIPAKGRRVAQLSADKKLIPLTLQEKSALGFSEQPVYQVHVSGRLSPLQHLGVPPEVDEGYVQLIIQALPAVELDGIAQGVADKRSLRAVPLEIGGRHYVVVEADVGVFYQAPKTSTGQYAFVRVTEKTVINQYLSISEQYRLVAERTNILQDRENIARLLFELEKNTSAFEQQVLLGKTATYEAYKNACEQHSLENELYGYAQKLLTGEVAQTRFFAMAKSSIADFKRLGERTLLGKEHHVKVLNTLLPLQSRAKDWVPLTVGSIALAQTAEKLSVDVQGANFAYAMVETAEGQRSVYYAFSGGQKAKNFKFKLHIPDSDTQVIEGVTYIDAGIRMRGQAPDPAFTSLPVLRDADHLNITEMLRYLDSERLIATILKQDLQGVALRDIHFFTLMDTCRSCGGVILPQTRLMFPGVNFSVSYLKNYNRV